MEERQLLMLYSSKKLLEKDNKTLEEAQSYLSKANKSYSKIDMIATRGFCHIYKNDETD
jgi:hypothetical protein